MKGKKPLSIWTGKCLENKFIYTLNGPEPMRCNLWIIYINSRHLKAWTLQPYPIADHCRDIQLDRNSGARGWFATTSRIKNIIKEKKVIAVVLDVWPALSNLLSHIYNQSSNPQSFTHSLFSWGSRVPKHFSRDGLLHSPVIVTLALPGDP